jgi:hypothetical protein
MATCHVISPEIYISTFYNGRYFMSQILQPNGLTASTYNGGKPRSTVLTFPLAGTNGNTFCAGDPLSMAGGQIGAVNAATAYPPATDQEVILGVFESITYQSSAPGVAPSTYPYWIPGTPISGNAYISMNSQPNQFYVIQADASLPQASIGSNYNLSNTHGGTAANGYTSQCVLHVATLGTTGGNSANWGQVKVVGLAPVTPTMQAIGGNAWGDPYTWVIVSINNGTFHLGTYGNL